MTMRQGVMQKPGVWRRFRDLLRRYFWLWIAYQTVKGCITLGLIWLPLWWAMAG